MKKHLVLALVVIATSMISADGYSQTSSQESANHSADKYENLSTIFYIDNLEDREVQKNIQAAFDNIDVSKLVASSFDPKMRELKVVYSSNYGKKEIVQLLEMAGVEHPIQLEKFAPSGKRFDLKSDGTLQLIDL